MSYTQFVKERIFEPLGMKSSTFSHDEAEKSGQLAQSFTLQGRRIPYWLKDNAAETMLAGPAGIFSNGEDMVRPLDLDSSILLTVSISYFGSRLS
jgi:CubicO group peptidase (beta-lactamase class C family)